MLSELGCGEKGRAQAVDHLIGVDARADEGWCHGNELFVVREMSKLMGG